MAIQKGVALTVVAVVVAAEEWITMKVEAAAAVTVNLSAVVGATVLVGFLTVQEAL